MSRRHPSFPWEPSDEQWTIRSVDVVCSGKGTHDTIVIGPLRTRTVPEEVNVPDVGQFEDVVHEMADTAVTGSGQLAHRNFVCRQCRANLSVSPDTARRLLDGLHLAGVSRVELLNLAAIVSSTGK